MKTNSFNEAIRRKLEQIQPEAGPEAWDRFQAHRQPLMQPLWKTVWAKAAMVFLALGAVAGGVHLAHVRQTTQLKQTVQHLTRQRDSLLSAQSGPLVPVPTGPQSRTDSGTGSLPESRPTVPNSGEVLTNRTPERGTPFPDTEPTGTPGAVPGPAAPDPISALTPERTMSPAVARLPKRRDRVEVPSVPSMTPSAERLAARTNPRRRRSDDLSNRSGRILDRDASPPAVHRARPTGVPSAPENPGFVPAERTIVAAVSRLRPRQVVIDSLPPSAPPTISYYELPKSVDRERAAATSAGLPLTGRLGLAGRVGAGQRSVQITGEVRLGERVGLQFGLQSGFIAGPRYSTEQEFERMTRRNFRRQYVPKLPPRFDILNISETYSVVSLPVRLTYYQPLAQDWWGVLAAGTDLDLSGRRRVQFDIYDFRPLLPEFARNEYRAAVPVVTFNTLSVAAGIEKRFGRVGLQLTSMWVLPVKAADYRGLAASWSGQFGLLYQLGNRLRRPGRSLSPPS